jgi:FkbM family methyltransferase
MQAGKPVPEPETPLHLQETIPVAPADDATPAPTTVTLTVRGISRDARLTLPAGDHITLAVEHSGTYYEHELLHAISTLPHGGTFVDAGAHYGNHSVFFGLECGADRIVSIEPNPTTYAGLVRNLEDNGLADRSTTVHAAIHESWRRVDIDIPAWEPGPDNAATSNTGMSRVEAAAGDGAVDAMPLDEILEDAEDVAVIKIDVEGNALGVVRSAQGTIERFKPVLVLEALSDEEQAQLVAFLVPLGYRAFGPYNWTPTWIWAAA